jgi:FADH2 O2-dependent halogenase
MLRHRVEILVIGSGFAGSLIAMIARRLGFSTALLERGRHPRFAIGESSTPLANLLLEEISEAYDLPGVRPLSKWGTWQKRAPQVACGLKRGFSFYHHELGRSFKSDSRRQRQLLVGASPRNEIADTHWYRPDFDHYLVQQAQALGVEYWDEVKLARANTEPNGMRLEGERKGQSVEFVGQFVIDASGPRGFLHRALKLPETPFRTMPPTQALFSHFADVAPLPNCFSADGLTPPYPPEDAAVHHVFDGGWIWVLKFNNGVTSAGVAATDALANALDLKCGEPAWSRLLNRLPSLRESFDVSRRIVPFIYQPGIAFQSRRITGPNWALVPSAAGVIDPLLSTGFPLALLGISRLARILERHWQRPSFSRELDGYARQTALELKTTARLVGALYATMRRFELFKALTLLYFAAASFSEAARRLGKGQLAESFLLCEHPFFARRLRQACGLAHERPTNDLKTQLKRLVNKTIAPFDVAGLTDGTRHPWYPARPEDLLAGAPKLAVSQDEITAMLKRCGMTKANGD